MATTFAEATEVRAIDSNAYAANLHHDWCVGAVPHGGYVTSLFLHVASTHFSTVLQAQNQPHTIVLHLEFLRRTREGSATFHVKHAKIGRQTSTIHLTLLQDDKELVVGYLTNSNMHMQEGVSLATGWTLEPPPRPVNLEKLANGQDDENWQEQKDTPFPNFRRVLRRVRQYLPRQGQPSDSICDEWLRLASGEKFTQESLGLVSDLWPQVIEGIQRRNDDHQKPPPFWYPTLVLNLDVKKALPAEGVDWLFTRVRAKKIEKGRQDLEVVILDEKGDLVALSHHVAMVLSAERNLAGRSRKNLGKI